MSSNNNLLEEYELIVHKFIKEALICNYENYKTSINNLSFNELLQFISRQNEGRGRNYNYSIEEVVQAYLDNNMDDTQKDELKYRIASSSIYNVAMERYVFTSIIKYLDGNINSRPTYLLNASPNSSDFSIIIENEVIESIVNLLNLQVDMEYLSSQYDGVVIHVDAKSIMGFKNLNDAIVSGEVLGKCEAKWNQISYVPPILEQAFRNNNSYMKKKYSVLDKIVFMDEKKYYTTSAFAVNLVYLDSNTNYFEIPIQDINAGIFNHLVYIITFPNGIHKNDYYDMFFNAGKGGYEEINNIRYPKDCRIVIKSANDYLKFKGLEEEGKGTIYRFDYINANESEYNIKYMNDNNEIKIKTIKVPCV